MSIINAIDVGARIGDAVSGFLFQYTKAQYEEKINELDTHIAQLNTHLDNLISLKDRIPTFWKDDNANKTVATLEMTIKNVQRDMETAQNLAQVFRDAVASFDTSNEKLHGYIEDALGLLNLFGE